MARAKKKKIEEVLVESPVVEEAPIESVIKAAEMLVAASEPAPVEEKKELELFTAYEFQAVRSEAHMLKISFRNSVHKLVKEMRLVDGFKVVVNPGDLVNVPSMFAVETNEEIPMGKFLIVK